MWPGAAKPHAVTVKKLVAIFWVVSICLYEDDSEEVERLSFSSWSVSARLCSRRRVESII